MAAMELEIEKQGLLRSGFSPRHPEVLRLEQESMMRQEGLKYLRDGPEGDSTGATPLLHLEENLFLPLRKIPETAQKYANIEKDVIVQSALMKLLLEQKAEALIAGENTVSTIQLLDDATVPEKKARPHRTLIVFQSERDTVIVNLRPEKTDSRPGTVLRGFDCQATPLLQIPKSHRRCTIAIDV